VNEVPDGIGVPFEPGRMPASALVHGFDDLRLGSSFCGTGTRIFSVNFGT